MISASEALELLREGNRRFAAGQPRPAEVPIHLRRAEVLEGQEPFAIILGCSDSRVPAEIVFDQGLGDLFVIRVAGNVVAPSLIGSVEFAAERFGTRLVVVLGHSQCGAVLATIEELRRYRMGQRFSSDADWVFQSSRRHRERWSNPLKCIRQAFQLAGAYEPHRGTHAIRHSVATAMLGNGVDIETVRQVLGHSSVLVTQGYLQTSDERKHAAARAGSLLRRGGRR